MLPAHTSPVPLEKGGSGRRFARVTLQDGAKAILCQYNLTFEENTLYADIADFLAQIGFPVPRVLARDTSECTLLLEDLGDTDLWALRSAPWPARRAAYQSALAALRHLHHNGLARWQALGDARPRLMPAFGAALYRWEQDYFLENTAVLRLDALSRAAQTALRSELDALAARLLCQPPQLVHRDCQSQNIFWRADAAYFIDFQGMRIGTGLYDLASLLWDPYVEFSPEQRVELLDYYHFSASSSPDANFTQAFLDASAQRLMQACGAYSYLGNIKGRKDFLAHLPRALRHLHTVTCEHKELPTLRQLVEILMQTHNAGEV